MTDKELRHLDRRELLEMLLAQTKRADNLQAELDKAKAELASRKLEIENAGSIAQASLQLSGIFQAADKAAQQYLENICDMADKAAQQYLENIQKLAEDSK